MKTSWLGDTGCTGIGTSGINTASVAFRFCVSRCLGFTSCVSTTPGIVRNLNVAIENWKRSHEVVFHCTSIVLCRNIENMAFILQKKLCGSAAASCCILYSPPSSQPLTLTPPPSARCLISRLHLLPCVRVVCLHFPFVVFCQVVVVD